MNINREPTMRIKQPKKSKVQPPRVAMPGFVCFVCGATMKGGEPIRTAQRFEVSKFPVFLAPDGFFRSVGTCHAACGDAEVFAAEIEAQLLDGAVPPAPVPPDFIGRVRTVHFVTADGKYWDERLVWDTDPDWLTA